jgi:hypothetical protein
MKKSWKDVPNFDGLEASNNGEIRKYRQFIHRRDYINTTCRTAAGGYTCVSYGGKTYFVHELVALAWIPNPKELPFINHKNGNKADNRIDNLEWCTGKHNTLHAIYELGHIPTFGIKPVNVFRNGILIMRAASVREAARFLGCESNQISRVCRGQRSHYMGYKIEFC